MDSFVEEMTPNYQVNYSLEPQDLSTKRSKIRVIVQANQSEKDLIGRRERRCSMDYFV